jgi:hypothetical protein
MGQINEHQGGHDRPDRKPQQPAIGSQGRDRVSASEIGRSVGLNRDYR